MRRALALLLAAVTACAPMLAFAGPPVQRPTAQAPAKPPRPAVRVSVVDFVTGDVSGKTLPREVVEACDILQIACVAVPNGGLQLALIAEPDDGLLGIALTWITMPCARVAVAAKERNVIAHEIAHLLGQPHVPVPGNLMYPAREGGGSDLFDFQLEAIAAEARGFGRFCAE